MKAHPPAKMKNIGQRIGNLPALSQARSHMEMFVAGEEVVENKIVDALRVSIDSDAGIEIGRAILDDHRQRAVVCFSAAGDAG